MSSRLSQKCHQICPIECYKEIYTLMQNKALFDTGANDSHVINVYPADMSLNLVYTPVVQFFELMTPVVNVVLLIVSFIALYLMLTNRIDNSSDINKID